VTANNRFSRFGRVLRNPWVIVSVCGCAILLVGILVGRFFLEGAGRSALLEREERIRQIDDAESVIVGLEWQVTVAENAGRIDQLAVRSIQESLDSLHAELQQMKQELKFYRRIVSPGKGKDELQIERFRMSSGPGGDRFSLTLSQGVGRNAKISAMAMLRFVGTLNGEKRVLSLKDVDAAKRKRLKFSFRYFQTISDALHFPDGFELQTVTISAEAQTKRRSKLSENWTSEQLKNGFEWGASATRPIAISAKGS
jgi:hypothetical protein